MPKFALFQIEQAERDLDDELQDHLASEIENNLRAGVTLEDALACCWLA